MPQFIGQTAAEQAQQSNAQLMQGLGALTGSILNSRKLGLEKDAQQIGAIQHLYTSLAPTTDGGLAGVMLKHKATTEHYLSLLGIPQDQIPGAMQDIHDNPATALEKLKMYTAQIAGGGGSPAQQQPAGGGNVQPGAAGQNMPVSQQTQPQQPQQDPHAMYLNQNYQQGQQQQQTQGGQPYNYAPSPGPMAQNPNGQYDVSSNQFQGVAQVPPGQVNGQQPATPPPQQGQPQQANGGAPASQLEAQSRNLAAESNFTQGQQPVQVQQPVQQQSAAPFTETPQTTNNLIVKTTNGAVTVPSSQIATSKDGKAMVLIPQNLDALKQSAQTKYKTLVAQYTNDPNSIPSALQSVGADKAAAIMAGNEAVGVQNPSQMTDQHAADTGLYNAQNGNWIRNWLIDNANGKGSGKIDPSVVWSGSTAMQKQNAVTADTLTQNVKSIGPKLPDQAAQGMGKRLDTAYSEAATQPVKSLNTVVRETQRLVSVGQIQDYFNKASADGKDVVAMAKQRISDILSNPEVLQSIAITATNPTNAQVASNELQRLRQVTPGTPEHASFMYSLETARNKSLAELATAKAEMVKASVAPLVAQTNLFTAQTAAKTAETNSKLAIALAPLKIAAAKMGLSAEQTKMLVAEASLQTARATTTAKVRNDTLNIIAKNAAMINTLTLNMNKADVPMFPITPEGKAHVAAYNSMMDQLAKLNSANAKLQASVGATDAEVAARLAEMNGGQQPQNPVTPPGQATNAVTGSAVPPTVPPPAANAASSAGNSYAEQYLKSRGATQ